MEEGMRKDVEEDMREDVEKEVKLGNDDEKETKIIDENGGTGSGAREKKSIGSPVPALFALYARSSIGKIIAVFACLVIAEGLSFHVVCRGLGQSGTVLYPGALYQGVAHPGAAHPGVIHPEKMIDMCFLKYIFLTALVLVSFILIVTEGDRSGCKSSYTLLRLKVSKKRQFAAKTVYNFLCLMMVFAVQILTAFVICRVYEAKLPSELVSPQYLFLTFYRNEFLHCILPMADWGKWICNFLLLLALAMDAAYVGNRNGVRLSLVNYCILVQWFVSEINSPVALLCALYCVLIIIAVLLRLFGVIGGGRDEEA